MTATLLALGAVLAVAALWPDARLPKGAPEALRLGDRGMRQRRDALPALVESIGAALSSGLSLQQAFAEVAPALPQALAAATRRAAASLALGEGLDRAFVAYRSAVPGEDLAPFAVVLGSFARAGGRVARSLSRVAALLRGRLALEDEVDALTAQGRASAAVLLLLAPLGALMLALAMPSYLPTLIGSGSGLLAAAVVLEVCAGLWLHRLLRSPSRGGGLASLLDAVVVGLEAGMTFEQAMRALVDRAPRVARLPEARRLLADLSLGCGAGPSLARFGASGPAESRIAALIASSTRFGAPLADLLVVQADALRDAERRQAQAAARRLPVLMLFPLTFCVLPALLIVFLGPPLMSLGQ
ncbi:MAG: type II secretion system F family protein [Candidatus Limnocylindria bacterium]